MSIHYNKHIECVLKLCSYLVDCRRFLNVLSFRLMLSNDGDGDGNGNGDCDGDGAEIDGSSGWTKSSSASSAIAPIVKRRRTIRGRVTSIASNVKFRSTFTTARSGNFAASHRARFDRVTKKKIK